MPTRGDDQNSMGFPMEVQDISIAPIVGLDETEYEGTHYQWCSSCARYSRWSRGRLFPSISVEISIKVVRASGRWKSSVAIAECRENIDSFGSRKLSISRVIITEDMLMYVS